MYAFHILLGVCLYSGDPNNVAKEHPLDGEIQNALKNLGSDKFPERKQAGALLRAAKPDDRLELALMKMCRDPKDAEISFSARSVLRDRLKERSESAANGVADAAVLKRVISDRGFDVFAFWLAKVGAKAKKEHWQLLDDCINDSVVTPLKKTQPRLPFKADYYKNAEPISIAEFRKSRTIRSYRLGCSELIEPDPVFRCSICAGGPFQKKGDVVASLVIAVGDVSIGFLSDSLVICDGDAKVAKCGGSAIIANGSVTTTQKNSTSVATANSTDTFPSIRFSRLNDYGLVVADMGGECVVSEAADDCALDLRPSDAVLSANGIQIKNANDLRTAIRESLFTGKLFLTVKRSDNIVDSVIPWELLPKGKGKKN